VTPPDSTLGRGKRKGSKRRQEGRDGRQDGGKVGGRNVGLGYVAQSKTGGEGGLGRTR